MKKPVKILIAGLVFVPLLGWELWDLVTDAKESDPIGFYQEKPIRFVTVAILTFLIVAAVMIGGRIRRRWVAKSQAEKPHLCDKCGYGLTGNVSGVCPECGEKIKSVSTPADTAGKNLSP